MLCGIIVLLLRVFIDHIQSFTSFESSPSLSGLG